MIENVLIRSLRASASAEPYSRDTTLIFAGETVSAQITLARVSGAGSARAQILYYCFSGPAGTTCPPHQEDLVGELHMDANRSMLVVTNAKRIVFRLTVRDMFAEAIATVFVHSIAPQLVPSPFKSFPLPRH